jgi:hypothetical protein
MVDYNFDNNIDKDSKKLFEFRYIHENAPKT